MKRTVLQVPMDAKLRSSAEKQAQKQGFSSLQEVVRVFVKRFADKEMNIGFEEKEEVLSKKAARRYDKMIDEIKEDKNVYVAKSVDDLMRQLHGDTLPQKLSQSIQKKHSGK